MKTRFLCLLMTLWVSAAFSQDFDIYVSDAGDFQNGPWKILKYDQNGDNPEVFINQNLGWPQDILFLESTNSVLVSNFTTNRISRFNAETGAFIDEFATGLAAPTRMKIGRDGLLYVLQWSGDGRVRRYELDGSFVDSFTSVAVSNSIGLDWDSAGNLYVSSYNQGTVRKFGPDGADLGLFISSNLSGPTNIWFAPNGELLVSDYDGGAIKRFSANGALLGNYITGLSQAEGIAYLPNGNLLVGNGGTRAVKMYDANGVFIEDLVASQSGGLFKPNAVVVRDNSFRINAGLNDVWATPGKDGAGILFAVFPNIDLLFSAWFTYDSERPAENATAVLGSPDQRWLTMQGLFEGNTANLEVFQSAGGVFDSASPAPGAAEAIGTMTIVFQDCANAMASYSIPSLGLENTILLVRIVGDNIALCDQLNLVSQP